MFYINVTILIIYLLFICRINTQDMYGAQYNNQLPDEIKQRNRQMPLYDDNNISDQQQEPCPGHGWQWRCDDNQQCIAQYDLCDGIAQCVDESDESEKYCRGMYPPHAKNRPYPPQNKPHQPDTVPESSSSSKLILTTLTPKNNSNSLLFPFKLILAGAAAFILVAGLGHLLMKKRQQLRAGVRNYRKGQAMVDDEDDLLISQMYS